MNTFEVRLRFEDDIPSESVLVGHFTADQLDPLIALLPKWGISSAGEIYGDAGLSGQFTIDGNRLFFDIVIVDRDA